MKRTLKKVLAKEFSIDPEANLSNRALAASFVVAWQTAKGRAKNQAEQEAAKRVGEAHCTDRRYDGYEGSLRASLESRRINTCPLRNASTKTPRASNRRVSRIRTSSSSISTRITFSAITGTG